MNAEQRQVCELVESLVAAHEQWEGEAHALWNSPNVLTGNTLTTFGTEVLDRIDESYRSRLQKFFVEGMTIRAGAFWKPPSHESASEHVTSIERQSDAFLVRTRMSRENGGIIIVDEYEYRVVWESKQPKLSEIRWLEGD